MVEHVARRRPHLCGHGVEARDDLFLEWPLIHRIISSQRTENATPVSFFAVMIHLNFAKEGKGDRSGLAE
jgi:hypothetical protein